MIFCLGTDPNLIELLRAFLLLFQVEWMHAAFNKFQYHDVMWNRVNHSKTIFDVNLE